MTCSTSSRSSPNLPFTGSFVGMSLKACPTSTSRHSSSIKSPTRESRLRLFLGQPKARLRRTLGQPFTRQGGRYLRRYLRRRRYLDPETVKNKKKQCRRTRGTTSLHKSQKTPRRTSGSDRKSTRLNSSHSQISY